MLDAKSGKRIWVRDDDGQDAGIAFSPDGRLLAHVRGNVRLLDAATGDVVAKCESPRCFFTAAIFTRDGTAVIAVTTGDSPIVVFDAKKGTELHRLTLSPRAIPAPFGRAIASLSPDGKTLAIASRDGKIHLWDTTTWADRAQISTRAELPMVVAFAPDGKSIVCAGALDMNKPVTERDPSTQPNLGFHCAAYEVSSGRMMYELPTAFAQRIAFSKDGKLLAADEAGDVLVLQEDSGKLVRRIKAHESMIFGISFSPDGKTLATAGRTDLGRRSEVKLWDLSAQ